MSLQELHKKEEQELKTTLSRAFRLLSAFTETCPFLTLADICRSTGIPKTTAHRILKELVKSGAIERGPNGYGIGVNLFELGSLHSGRRLRDTVLPYMEGLHALTGETVHLGILNGLDVVYLDKISAKGHLKVELPSRLGGRIPAYCTGVGKALLAHTSPSVLVQDPAAPLQRLTPHSITDSNALRKALATVKSRGFAVDREECAMGFVCAGAPIFDINGWAIAALSVSGPSGRLDPEKVAPAAQALAQAATKAIRRDPALRNFGRYLHRVRILGPQLGSKPANAGIE